MKLYCLKSFNFFPLFPPEFYSKIAKKKSVSNGNELKKCIRRERMSHCLRAIIPFASRAIRGGIRRELLSAVMGHSEEQVTTQVYGHLMDDSFGDNVKVMHSVENGLARQ